MVHFTTLLVLSTLALASVALPIDTSTSKSDEKKVLPEKFFGSWAVAESENFEPYLVARGFGWFMRQIILYSPVTKIFEKSITQPGTYNAFIITPTKTAHWYGWSLGKSFDGIYVDDDKHEITFDYDSQTDTFTEFHQNLDQKSEPTDLIKYEVNKDNRLVMTVEAKGVVCKRYYNKQDN